MRRRARAVTAVATACLVLSACSGDGDDTSSGPTPTPPTPPSTTVSPTATSSSPSASTSPSTSPTASTGASAAPGEPLRVRTTTTRTTKGNVAYTITLPVFTGPRADLVNARVQRSADDASGILTEGALPDVPSTVGVTGAVTRNDGRTVQVKLALDYFAEGAAHPNDGVSTVVLRASDAGPVLLTDVLSDPSQALAAALRRAVQVAARTGQDDPTGRLTTQVRDWANWQAGPAGFTFFFSDYQAGSHAAGLRSVDVPWSLVRAWVRDDAYALLGPAGS